MWSDGIVLYWSTESTDSTASLHSIVFGIGRLLSLGILSIHPTHLVGAEVCGNHTMGGGIWC